jgi:hypothetical protein
MARNSYCNCNTSIGTWRNTNTNNGTTDNTNGKAGNNNKTNGKAKVNANATRIRSSIRNSDACDCLYDAKEEMRREIGIKGWIIVRLR